jgi:hypothetical protein
MLAAQQEPARYGHLIDRFNPKELGFRLDTDGGPPIEVRALQDWRCEGKHRLTAP